MYSTTDRACPEMAALMGFTGIDQFSAVRRTRGRSSRTLGVNLLTAGGRSADRREQLTLGNFVAEENTRNTVASAFFVLCIVK